MRESRFVPIYTKDKSDKHRHTKTENKKDRTNDPRSMTVKRLAGMESVEVQSCVLPW
jgi:hypothetical protein